MAPEPKLKVGAGIDVELPNVGAGLLAPNEGAGVALLVPPPNVNGLLSVVLEPPPPKLKLGAGVDPALPPNLKPVDAGWGVGAGNLKPVPAGWLDPPKLKLGGFEDGWNDVLLCPKLKAGVELAVLLAPNEGAGFDAAPNAGAGVEEVEPNEGAGVEEVEPNEGAGVEEVEPNEGAGVDVALDPKLKPGVL